jgi:hypothetical protein
VLTSTTGYSSTNLNPGSVGLISQYCNGARVPPENGGLGYNVPVGIADSVVPNPIFSLTPNATVDEGNNWVNMSWGPLSLLNPVTSTATTNVYLGNYALQSSSPAIDAITCTQVDSHGCEKNIGVSGVNSIVAPPTDFFGNPRPDPANLAKIDVGAVEYQGLPSGGPPTITTISPNSGYRGTAVAVTITGTNFSSLQFVTVTGGGGVTVSNATANAAGTQITATFTISGTATLGGHSVTVTTSGGSATDGGAFTVLGPSLTSISPTNGNRGTTVAVTISGEGLQDATGVTMGGGGISCTLSGTPTGTTVNASCTISGTAALGARNVRVATPDAPGGGVTLPGAFAVGQATALSPASWNFGTVAVAGAASATHTFTLTGTPGTAITYSLTGTNATDFTRPAGGAGGSCGAALPGSGTCTIAVRFKPLATGARSGTLNVTSGTTVSSTLTGTGI